MTRIRTTATALVAVLLVMLAGCTDTDAGSTSAGTSATPTVDGAARQRVTDALTAALPGIRRSTPVLDDLEVPGVSVAVRLPGTGTVTAADGRSDITDGAKLTADSLFHVGSVSKTFTAALILQLDQEGRLSVDDPIATHVEYPNGKAISVRQLLDHTSGIPDITAVKDIASIVKKITPQETVRRVAAEAEPLFAPGTSYSYSNTNYLLLGLIAEKVTGRAWHQEVRARFLDRLDLGHTWVYGYEDAPEGVTGYSLSCEKAGCTRPRLDEAKGLDWKFAWAAGAVVSTPKDLATWGAALVGGDVLDREHRTMMQKTTPQSKKYWSGQEQTGVLRYTGYGLGLYRYKIKGVGTGWGHSGSISGFNSELVYVADRQLSFALVANIESAFGLTRGNGSGKLLRKVVKAAA